MIDSHSHVLPGLDDGSRSVEESAAMLRKMEQQGITTVAATPHFYASATEPAEFFEKRQASFERLRRCEALPQMDLRLGAEVLYYEGLHHQKTLLDFRISGTELLLLELPFDRWSERTLQGIVDLNTESRLTVVLAHIDRYLAWQPISVFAALASNGILMQVNASSLLNWKTRRKTLRLFQQGLVQFVGSDCHDSVHRPPNVAAGMEYLQKKLGQETVSQLCEAEEDLFRCLDFVT